MLLTVLVSSVVILDQKGVTVVPDLLAGLRVVAGLQRLQIRVEDGFFHGDVDRRLMIPSWHLQGPQPHGVHWRPGQEEEKKKQRGEMKKEHQISLSCCCFNK